MNNNLKCFISSSVDAETDSLKNILSEYGVEVFDIYDFSVGQSIQQILKRKLRQSDFAIFILTEENKNVLYEMGVCEGMGKQHFIFLNKNLNIPFYVANKLFIHADFNNRDFLRNSIEKILQDVRKKRRKAVKPTTKNIAFTDEKHNMKIKNSLKSYLSQIKNFRMSATGSEIELIVENVFRTLNLNYVDNTTQQDKGVDFALWNDELGKVIGNPIIIEVKYGNISSNRFKKAEEQIRKYIKQSEAKIAILLYLDKSNKRHRIKSGLSPLFISYDLEDFVKDLIDNSFERIILNQRNKIAHGID